MHLLGASGCVNAQPRRGVWEHCPETQGRMFDPWSRAPLSRGQFSSGDENRYPIRQTVSRQRAKNIHLRPQNGVCLPLSGFATNPGPPERVDLVSVNSRELRWRSLHCLPRQLNPFCGRAPRFKIKGPKRLPARQNSDYGYHNHVSVCVNLRVDDSLGNRTISSNDRAGCTVPAGPAETP